MNHDEHLITQAGTPTPAAPSPRAQDFTLEELFGKTVQRIAPDWYSCIECGACVRYTHTHVKWHNKLLP